MEEKKMENVYNGDNEIPIEEFASDFLEGSSDYFDELKSKFPERFRTEEEMIEQEKRAIQRKKKLSDF
jgi:hypothetical protein